uniref:Uncharacterized protein n=1 Tax=Trypanosoma vivax (strain Y486) TaxID=1055687 RepID=G0U9C4_TRYVY|nr:hypothetical protein TVY486_1116930 [Trypanosoma vivax Y486]
MPICEHCLTPFIGHVLHCCRYTYHVSVSRSLIAYAWFFYACADYACRMVGTSVCKDLSGLTSQRNCDLCAVRSTRYALEHLLCYLLVTTASAEITLVMMWVPVAPLGNELHCGSLV